MLTRSVTSLVVLFCLASGSIAGTWRVEQDGTGDFTTIQPAVDVAASGDTILIGPGWYQDLHQVDHFGSPIDVAAYWTDNRDLYFIGAGSNLVTVGPSVYSPYNDGPQGVSTEGGGGQATYVAGIRFVNLQNAISAYSVQVEQCVFQGGRNGIAARNGQLGLVRSCQFVGIENASCYFTSFTSVNVENSDLGEYVYFGEVSNGILSDCTASGRKLCHYYMSNGLVEGNESNCYAGAGAVACISIGGGSHVTVGGNIVRGGANALLVGDVGSMAELHQNVLEDQASHTIVLWQGAEITAAGNDIGKAPLSDTFLVRCYDYTSGATPMRVDMENNFWGYTNSYYLDLYIWDYKDDPNLMVEIDYDPFAGGSVPSEDESWGSVKALYLGR